MQTLRVKPGALNTSVIVPPSKSYANRALIISALLSRSLTLKNLPKATDVTILLDCFKRIGLILVENEDAITVENSFPECETVGCELNVGEGGTTARFLATMLLLGERPYKLILGKRLKDRPWNEFLQIARSLGGRASLEGNILSIQGPISIPEELTIDCSETTQFATAFQLMEIRRPIKVNPINLNSSQSYWLMTEKILNDIKKNNIYNVPADWSSASYPLAFAGLNQRIEFPGLKFDSYQADSKFVEVLKRYNCLTETNEGLIAVPGIFNGTLKIDVSDALDLVPTLAYFLSHIDGSHELLNVQNLIHKESDRLHEVIKLLEKFERKSSTDGCTLKIEGHSKKVGHEVHLSMPDDHRMVMVGTLFLLHHGGGSITPQEAVMKSYPDFFNLISKS